MKSFAAAVLGLASAGLALASGLVAFTVLNARRATAKVPPVGRFVDLDGARLHYVDDGQGPTIVMIHGLGGQLQNFTYALTGLLTDRFRVISVDRPGSGYSTASGRVQPGLAEQAAILADFIRALNLGKPLVVGHSLGGAVALALALDHPEAVGALALLSPLTHRQDIVPDAFKALVIRSSALRHAVGWTLATPLGKLGRKEGRALVFGPDAVPDDFDTRGGGALTLRPANFYAAASEASAGNADIDRQVALYPELAVPVAILFARGDRILDPAVHGTPMLAASPRVSLDWIDGGHMFPVTAPAETAHWIAVEADTLAHREAGRPQAKSSA